MQRRHRRVKIQRAGLEKRRARAKAEQARQDGAPDNASDGAGRPADEGTLAEKGEPDAACSAAEKQEYIRPRDESVRWQTFLNRPIKARLEEE